MLPGFSKSISLAGKRLVFTRVGSAKVNAYNEWLSYWLPCFIRHLIPLAALSHSPIAPFSGAKGSAPFVSLSIITIIRR